MQNRILILSVALLIVIPHMDAMAQEPITLDSCYVLALRNNATAIKAEHEIGRANEVKKQAATKYLPQVSVNAMAFHAYKPIIEADVTEVLPSNTVDVFNVLYTNYGEALGLGRTLSALEYGRSVSAIAMQPVFMGGQIVNGNRLAQVGVQAAELQKEMAERDLMQSVEESYWLVVQLQAKQGMIRQMRSLLDTISRDVEMAVKSGLAINNDLLRVRLKQNEVDQTAMQLENGLALSRRALCQSIGIEYSDSIIVDTLQSGIDYDVPVYNSADTTVESRLLRLQIEASRLQRSMVIGQALPSVMVGAGYSYGNYSNSTWRGNAVIGVAVNIPITGWNETSHKIREYDHRIASECADYDDAVGKLELRHRQAYDLAMQGLHGIELAQSAREQASENLRLVRMNYDAGLSPLSDLMEAQTLLQKAETDYIDAVITYRIHLDQYMRY